MPAAGTPLPLDLRGVTFVSSLSWSTVPNGASVDRRAAAIARPSALGLPPAALSWLLAIAGPRYDAKKQRLRVSSDAHATAARNRRAVLETLVALAVEARRLAGKHGALPVPRTMPKYSHTV